MMGMNGARSFALGLGLLLLAALAATAQSPEPGSSPVPWDRFRRHVLPAAGGRGAASP